MELIRNIRDTGITVTEVEHLSGLCFEDWGAL
jgi:hypothetical protein